MSEYERDTERIRELEAEVERLRDFIWSLDGRIIASRGEGDTFIDEGMIRAADILTPPKDRGEK